MIVITAFIPSEVSIAEAPKAPAPKTYTTSEIIDLTREYANRYHVSFDTMMRIMKCENNTFNPKRQAEIRYNFSDARRGIVKGEQEMSYGLVMIHLPDHPSVSLEEATDPEFAINFLAENLSKGRGRMWSCY